MKTITIKNCKFGEGLPKIAVPIVAKTSAEILEAVRNARTNSPKCVDLVEWRADFFEDILTPRKALNLLNQIRDILHDMPLLFTLRSKEEGGQYLRNFNEKYYCDLLMAVIRSEKADLIDVEYTYSHATDILNFASISPVCSVISAHYFDCTPDDVPLARVIRNMMASKADMIKLAVTPKTYGDVGRLLRISSNCSAKNPDVPFIKIAMGSLGVSTRICGESFNSPITFGTLGASSAPGQISAEKLKDILNVLHAI